MEKVKNMDSPEMVQMSHQEIEEMIAKIVTDYEKKCTAVSEEAYQRGFNDCQKKMLEEKESKCDLEKKYINLDAKHNQLLRAMSELVKYLLY